MLDSARFEQLISQIRAAKLEIDLSRVQCTRPKHLFDRTRRSIVQAVQAIVSMSDEGLGYAMPQVSWLMDSMRFPGNPLRAPLHVTFGGREAQIPYMKLGDGCDATGAPTPKTCVELWNFAVSPMFRGRSPNFKANAGGFDFPNIKTDENGRALGKDGKPLQMVSKIDGESGQEVGARLNGEVARVTDDYDESDLLEHLRSQAADWSDALDAGFGFLQTAFDNHVTSSDVAASDHQPALRRPAALADGPPEPTLTPFVGGELVMLNDRVELCGVDICSGPRSMSKRVVLDLLSRRRSTGTFIAYSGRELEAEIKRCGGDRDAASVIRDLRATISEALRNRANINCERNDVILSGGPGYRFAESLSVQLASVAGESGITDIAGAENVRNVRSNIQEDVRNISDAASEARVTWILRQLTDGQQLRAPAVVKEFRCSLKTAQRDLVALKKSGNIEFIGPPRTGYYRLRRPKAGR